MPRWRNGQDTINALLERGHLLQVTADTETAERLVTTSERHVQSAATLAHTDPEAAFSLAYDAARKATTALLAHLGLRPPTAGSHLAVVDAINAQFPGVAGLKSLDRLRRRRNPADYPDPAGYDPITPDEAAEALEAARATVNAAHRLLDAPQLGVF
jgi:HEPN domain-containing protein